MGHLILLLFLSFPALTSAKEIALTFDDGPYDDSLHFESMDRTKKLIQELKNQDAGPAMVFAVACRFSDQNKVSKQLLEWKNSGHIIASHSCSHPDLHKVSTNEYLKNLGRADRLLKRLIPSQSKFFRYPYLHEGATTEARDKVRSWLKDHHYRNGYVSIDNDEWMFHSKMNRAKELKKSINYKNVEKIYLDHLLAAVEFYDALAVKLLGRSPKHVLLLHEIDSSVLFIGQLIVQLRAKGWKIISPLEAYKDPIYLEQPKNLYSNNGLIAQLAEEKRLGHFAFKDSLEEKLDRVLGIIEN